MQNRFGDWEWVDKSEVPKIDFDFVLIGNSHSSNEQCDTKYINPMESSIVEPPRPFFDSLKLDDPAMRKAQFDVDVPRTSVVVNGETVKTGEALAKQLECMQLDSHTQRYIEMSCTQAVFANAFALAQNHPFCNGRYITELPREECKTEGGDEDARSRLLTVNIESCDGKVYAHMHKKLRLGKITLFGDMLTEGDADLFISWELSGNMFPGHVLTHIKFNPFLPTNV
jgi:hypothetical protein